MSKSKGKQHAEDVEESEGVVGKSKGVKEECMVCTEAFDSGKRSKVVCPFCKEGAPSACRECVQTYLLGMPTDPHCMGCKHSWSLVFFVSTFPKSFVTSTYRKNRQDLAVEVERSKMSEAMPLVEARKGSIVLEKRIKEMKMEIRALQNRMQELVNEKHALDEANKRGEAVVKAQYLFHCPFGECRGLVQKASYRCSLCEQTVCPSCHGKRGDGHVCKDEDRENAKAVMDSTRPCPNCATRIFRAQGCDVMFCTQCHTGFNWRTNKLIKGAVGNPHYYELQERLGARPVPREPGDVVCGGLLDWTTLAPHTGSLPPDQRAALSERLQNIHRLVSEVDDYLQGHLRERDTMDIRVAYLEEEIDMVGLKRRLFLRKRVNEKNKEMRNILDTLRTSLVERFRTLNERLTATRGRGKKRMGERLGVVVEMVTEADQILTFCNQAMRDALSTMGYNRTPQLEYGKRFLEQRTNVFGGNTNGRLITVPLNGAAESTEEGAATGEVDEE